MLSHLHRVASYQVIIISSLPPFFCGQREIIHGYTQAVIFALHVTLGGAVDCQSFKHVTLKNLVMDDIVIDSKLEVLTSYCFLCHSGEGQIEFKQHDLEMMNDAHSNGAIDVKENK